MQRLRYRQVQQTQGIPQMANCCEDKSCEMDAMRDSHGRVLWIVLAINAVMFFVEGSAGLIAHQSRCWRTCWTCWAMPWCMGSASLRGQTSCCLGKGRLHAWAWCAGDGSLQGVSPRHAGHRNDGNLRCAGTNC
ncbi:protein of unknown function [Acidithiobacillus ferrivorans]|uniref:Cation transporter n=2 Tax=root TaxID=1 RepID=A0A060UKS4_9PROT|nr:conserved hypothetical protein [Acidithiobacillus ferrivorans]SMH66696.1 protein of unknown function [Acidithiobacillus ferrivorans]